VVSGAAAQEAERIYAQRFAGFSPAEFADYCPYVFRPRRVKLFDEPVLGDGVFVSAKVGADGKLVWERTEVYHAAEPGIWLRFHVVDPRDSSPEPAD
jgi:hypothetical protein